MLQFTQKPVDGSDIAVGAYWENKTTGPEAHLVMADRAVSRLDLNRYIDVPIQSLVIIWV